MPKLWSATLEAEYILTKLDDGVVLNFRKFVSQQLLEQAKRAQDDADNYRGQASKIKADMATDSWSRNRAGRKSEPTTATA